MSEKRAYVGMDLDTSMGSITNALIAAIEEDNEGVIVEDFSVYKKVKVPGKLVVNRETVEEHLVPISIWIKYTWLCLHVSDLSRFGRRTANHPMG